MAKELGAHVSVLLKTRGNTTSVSLRKVSDETDINLGAYLRKFSSKYGISGGGHPKAAGGKINSKDKKQFLQELFDKIK